MIPIIAQAAMIEIVTQIFFLFDGTVDMAFSIYGFGLLSFQRGFDILENQILTVWKAL